MQISPPFLPKEKREEAASPIRQPSEADSVYVFCRSSKGYISSAKPVKSALGRSLDSTEMGTATPPFTIQRPELGFPSTKFSRSPTQSLRHSSDLSENSADTSRTQRASGNSVTQLSNVLRVTRRRTDRESLSRLQFPGWISAPLPPFRTLAPLKYFGSH